MFLVNPARIVKLKAFATVKQIIKNIIKNVTYFKIMRMLK